MLALIQAQGLLVWFQLLLSIASTHCSPGPEGMLDTDMQVYKQVLDYFDRMSTYNQFLLCVWTKISLL